MSDLNTALHITNVLSISGNKKLKKNNINNKMSHFYSVGLFVARRMCVMTSDSGLQINNFPS